MGLSLSLGQIQLIPLGLDLPVSSGIPVGCSRWAGMGKQSLPTKPDEDEPTPHVPCGHRDRLDSCPHAFPGIHWIHPGALEHIPVSLWMANFQLPAASAFPVLQGDSSFRIPQLLPAPKTAKSRHFLDSQPQIQGFCLPRARVTKPSREVYNYPNKPKSLEAAGSSPGRPLARGHPLHSHDPNTFFLLP